MAYSCLSVCVCVFVCVCVCVCVCMCVCVCVQWAMKWLEETPNLAFRKVLGTFLLENGDSSTPVTCEA